MHRQRTKASPRHVFDLHPEEGPLDVARSERRGKVGSLRIEQAQQSFCIACGPRDGGLRVVEPCTEDINLKREKGRRSSPRVPSGIDLDRYESLVVLGDADEGEGASLIEREESVQVGRCRAAESLGKRKPVKVSSGQH